MAKGGAKRKPNNVHLIRGTFRQDRHGDPDDAIQAPAKIPACPKHLTGEARKEWNRIRRLLKEHNHIAELDRSTLAQYCELWAEFVMLGHEFQAAKHAQLRVCASELGLTPASRASLTGGSKGKKTGNRFSGHVK